MGAAVPEALYAFTGFWGTRAVVARFPFLLPVSLATGSALLTLVGVYLLFQKPPSEPQRLGDDESSREGWRNGLLGFSLIIANPMLILSWSAAAGVAESTGLLGAASGVALPFAVGVGVGVVSWFAVLLGLLERFQARMNAKILGHVVRAMGGVLVATGLVMGARVLAKWQ